jgi:hypothetical protein
MKFLIFGLPYRNSSAGIRVLHRLGDELKKLGYNSFVFTDWKQSAQLIPHVGECVVIYPESVRGNPLCAKNVVRYVLNTPGYLGFSDSVYPESELVFVYSEALIPATQAATSQVIDESRVMEISVIEPWLFKENPAVEKVYDAAFWVGKGVFSLEQTKANVTKYLEGKKLIQITYELPSTREALALLFQSSREFVTVDNFTAMVAEARLCGCKATVIDENGMVESTNEIERWRTLWHETGCIRNFVEICQDRFAAVAAAVAV